MVSLLHTILKLFWTRSLIHIAHTRTREYSYIFCPIKLQDQRSSQMQQQLSPLNLQSHLPHPLSFSVSWKGIRLQSTVFILTAVGPTERSAKLAGGARHKIQNETGFINLLSFLTEGSISNFNSKRFFSPVIHNFASSFFFPMTLDQPSLWWPWAWS